MAAAGSEGDGRKEELSPGSVSCVSGVWVVSHSGPASRISNLQVAFIGRVGYKGPPDMVRSSWLSPFLCLYLHVLSTAA